MARGQGITASGAELLFGTRASSSFVPKEHEGDIEALAHYKRGGAIVVQGADANADLWSWKFTLNVTPPNELGLGDSRVMAAWDLRQFNTEFPEGDFTSWIDKNGQLDRADGPAFLALTMTESQLKYGLAKESFIELTVQSLQLMVLKFGLTRAKFIEKTMQRLLLLI